jgi:hypothetical protein
MAEAPCSESDGTFQGLGTACDLCSGACLKDQVIMQGQCGFTTTISCFETSDPHECSLQQGTFMGAGTDCAGSTGACCLEAGCVDGLRPQTCSQLGGRFQGLASRCSRSVCRGACCIVGGGCIDDRFGYFGIDACLCRNTFGGVYQGDDTVCGPNLDACPTPLGACCMPFYRGYPGNCISSTTKAECDLLLGTFQGDDSTCSLSACPSGPCPGFGDCCEPHRSPGCDNQSCCERVCAADTACCLSRSFGTHGQWDEICVRLASRLCGTEGNPYCQNGPLDLNHDGQVDLKDLTEFQRRLRLP